MSNWTRAHDAYIARECEGLEVWVNAGDGAICEFQDDSIPHYLTDPAAAIRAAEAWKAQRPNNRWWGVRHEGDIFSWACESYADARERVANNSGHGNGDSVAAAIATALCIVTGGPA
jgi:hypothetical protein